MGATRYIAPPDPAFEFNYTGETQQAVLTPGIYKIEMWGADGRDSANTPGGYSYGFLDVGDTTTIYVAVGGHGIFITPPTPPPGGWNGGGGTTNNQSPCNSGGGATHIALMDGTLAAIGVANQDQVLMVAGGGPGHAGSPATYGCGGGINSYGSADAMPATQTTGYAFGQGAFGEKAGAGGGWYGGNSGNYTGATNNRNSSGGSGHLHESIYDGETIAYRDGNPNWKPNPLGGSNNHGFVRIYHCVRQHIPRPIKSTLEPLTVSPTGNPWVPVSNLTEFQNMNATNNYYLTADIDGQGAYVYNSRWGDYNAGRLGWFDGRGHTLKNFVVATGGNANGLLGPVNCCNDPGEYSVQNVTLENITVLGGASNRSVLFGTTGWVDNAVVQTDPNNGKQAKWSGGEQCTRCRNITLKNCVVNNSGTPSRYTSILVNNHRSPLYFENLAIIGQTGVNYMIDWESNSLGTLYIDKFYMNSPAIGNPNFSASAGLNPLVISNCYLKGASYTGMTTVTAADFTTPSTYSGFTFGNPWRMTDDGPVTEVGTWRLNAIKSILSNPTPSDAFMFIDFKKDYNAGSAVITDEIAGMQFLPVSSAYASMPLTPIPEQSTAGDWQPIGTLEEFLAMTATGNYYLTADIDGEGMNWIVPFAVYSQGRRGWFDGRGFTIRNFTNTSNVNGGCLLGSVRCNNQPGEFTIQNVTFENISNLQTGGDNKSLLVGVCNVSATGITDANNGLSCVGGTVRVRNITFKDCQYTPGNMNRGSLLYCEGNVPFYASNISVIGQTGTGVRTTYQTSSVTYVDGFYINSPGWTLSGTSGAYYSFTNAYSKDTVYSGFTTVTSANFTTQSTYPLLDFNTDWIMDATYGPVTMLHKVPASGSLPVVTDDGLHLPADNLTGWNLNDMSKVPQSLVSGSWSFEFYFKSGTTTPATTHVLLWLGATSSGKGFGLGYNANNYNNTFVWVLSDPRVGNKSIWSDGQLHQFAGTYDSSNRRLSVYLDGTKVSTTIASATNISITGYPFCLFGNNWYTAFQCVKDQYMKYLAGYTYCKTDAQVAADFALMQVGINVLTSHRIWARPVVLTFDPNTEEPVTGPNPASKQVTKDLLFGPLATIACEGYYFNGWWTDPDGSAGSGTRVYPETEVTQNASFSLYADWHVILTIIFDGGVAPDPAEQQAPSGLPVGTLQSLPIPEATGYVFGGWYRYNDTQYQERITDDTIMDSNTTLLTARWGTVATVEFYADDVLVNTLTYGMTLPFGSLPTLDPATYGHTTFDGWQYHLGPTVTAADQVPDGILFFRMDALFDGEIDQSLIITFVVSETDSTQVAGTITPRLVYTEDISVVPTLYASTDLGYTWNTYTDLQLIPSISNNPIILKADGVGLNYLTNLITNNIQWGYSTFFRITGSLKYMVTDPTAEMSPGAFAQMFASQYLLDPIPTTLLKGFSTLGQGALWGMFMGASRITTVPPIFQYGPTTGAHCMRKMFQGCSNIVMLDPHLWDDPLFFWGFCALISMFSQCSKLAVYRHITWLHDIAMNFSTTAGSNYQITDTWQSNKSGNENDYCGFNSNAYYYYLADQTKQHTPMIVQFVQSPTNHAPASGTVTPFPNGTKAEGVTLTYSLDFGATWQEWTSGAIASSGTNSIMFRATGQGLYDTGSTAEDPWTFSSYFILEGSMAGMVNDPLLPLNSRAFAAMFKGSSAVSMTTYFVPFEFLTASCFQSMFQNCTYLTTLANLYALSYPTSACASMYQGCSNLRLYTSGSDEWTMPMASTWTGTQSVATAADGALTNMFLSIGSGATVPATPALNTTYYRSAT